MSGGVRRFLIAAFVVAVVLSSSYSNAAATSRNAHHVATPRGVIIRQSQTASICDRVCHLFRRECVAGCNELPLVGGSDHIRRDGCIRYTCGFNYSRCRQELQCANALSHKRTAYA